MTPDALAAWREIEPHLPAAGLAALAAALEADDSRLIRGRTTKPSNYLCFAYLPLEGADAVSFALWQAHGCRTVGELDARLAAFLDVVPLAVLTRFANAWDDTPPAQMRREMLEILRPVEASHA
jgi:hypothetical protein